MLIHDFFNFIVVEPAFCSHDFFNFFCIEPAFCYRLRLWLRHKLVDGRLGLGRLAKPVAEPRAHPAQEALRLRLRARHRRTQRAVVFAHRGEALLEALYFKARVARLVCFPLALRIVIKSGDRFA